MDDLDFFRALAALTGIPPELRAELGRRQLAAHRSRALGGAFTFTRTARRDEFDVDGQLVRSDAAGMQALSLAALNPGRDVPLGTARSRRAWRAAIERALSTVGPLSPGLARALAPGESKHAGVWLSVDRDGRVWARWARPANVNVEATVTVP